MEIGIVIYTNELETVWNALRFGNFSLKKGDSVKVFLLGKGVETTKIDSDKFDVQEEMEKLMERGGEIFGCGTCLKIREREGSDLCPISTMENLYNIINESDKILTF